MMRKISRYAIRKKEVIFQLEVIKVSLRGLADSEFQAIYGTKRKRHAPALQAAVSSKAFFCVGCDKSKGLNKQRLTVSKDNKKNRHGRRRRVFQLRGEREKNHSNCKPHHAVVVSANAQWPKIQSDPYPVRINLNKEWLPKQKIIQNFNIDAQGFRKTRNENPPTQEIGVTS